MKSLSVILGLLACLQAGAANPRWELERYKAIPRETIHEYRFVDGIIYDIGIRKTWETVRHFSAWDTALRARVRNSAMPLPKWIYIGHDRKVWGTHDKSLVLGPDNNGRVDNMILIKNHPKFSEIANDDTIRCWVLPTGKVEATLYGRLRVYNHGIPVEKDGKPKSRKNGDK